MPLSLGDTFEMSGTGGLGNPAGSHLMICFATVGDDWIIVPVVSGHSDADVGCNLVEGDHEFVKHESRIDFGWLKRVSKAHVEDEIAKGRYRPRAAISRDLAASMYSAFLVSEEVEPWVETLCRDKVTGYLSTLS